MPKVTFVNEHREVEVTQGSLISDAAAKLGIDVCREHFAGTQYGNHSVWVDGEAGCVSEPTFIERWFGRCKGQRRLANRARVLKDLKVWTQQGMSGRTGQERDIDPPPRPSEDDSDRFDHEHSTAGTAWNVYGHPKTIGSGTREAPKYEPPKKKPAKKAAPAKDKAADAKAKKAEAKDEAKAKKDEPKADKAEAKDEAKAKKAEPKADKAEAKDEAKAKKDEPKADKAEAKDEAKAKKADAKDEPKADKAEAKDESKAKKDEGKAADAAGNDAKDEGDKTDADG
jgi:hypothetical protein